MPVLWGVMGFIGLGQALVDPGNFLILSVVGFFFLFWAIGFVFLRRFDKYEEDS